MSYERIRDWVVRHGKQDLPGCYSWGPWRVVCHNNMEVDVVQRRRLRLTWKSDPYAVRTVRHRG